MYSCGPVEGSRGDSRHRRSRRRPASAMCWRRRRQRKSTVLFLFAISTIVVFATLHRFSVWLSVYERQAVDYQGDIGGGGDAWKTKGEIPLWRRLHPPAVTTTAPPLNLTPDALWPHPSRPYDDRILAQLAYEHPARRGGEKTPLKTIYLTGGFRGQKIPGQTRFLLDKCLVDRCALVAGSKNRSSADAVLFDNMVGAVNAQPRGQIWIVYILESPMTISTNMRRVDWTATYRTDSTIVTPYEKFVAFRNASAVFGRRLRTNYAAKRTRLVAWFVSNCRANNDRLQYAEELQQTVQVDIYGACGNMSCSRRNWAGCFKMLTKTYKFYLAFENSNCRSYITEKFYDNALW